MNEELSEQTASVDRPHEQSSAAEISSVTNNFEEYMPITSLQPPRMYSPIDRYYAAAAIFLGFMIVKTQFETDSNSGPGLMWTLIAIALAVFNYCYCRTFQMNGSKTTRTIFIMNIVLSLSYTVTDNSSVTLLCTALIVAFHVYYAYAAYREGSRSVIHNALRAAFKSPFYEYSAVFGALFQKSAKSSELKKSDMKKVWSIVGGAVLSIPLCAIVIALLGDADSQFKSMFSFSLDGISDWLGEYVFSNLLILGLSLPIGMYIFSAVYSRAYKMNNESALTPLPRRSRRIVPPAMCASFLAPLTVIYFIFTVMQAFRLIGFFMVQTLGKRGVVHAPDFSYADYARQGFFQLCAVAVINLAVISVIMFFSKRQKGQLVRFLKIFVVTFCVLTHLLIATALAKMIMYIDIYGMTPKRVQTSVFMIYLFAMFVVLIVKQFKDKISFTKIACCAAAAVLALLAFIPTDALITKYNISRCEKGEISWIGYSAITDLDASALIVLSNAAPGSRANFDFRKYCSEHEFLVSDYTHMTVWDFNIPRYIAGIKMEMETETETLRSKNNE